MKKLLILIPVLLLFIHTASAQLIWSSNSLGVGKDSFYENESVYLTTDNISTSSITVDVYVVNDSNSWVNNTILTSFVSATKTITTNGSGYIEPNLIWNSLIPGKYDIVVDVDRNGNYTSNVDYVDNLTATGFTVYPIPVPILTFSAGPNSPSVHTWNTTATGYNPMLQLEAKADNGRAKISSFDIVSFGSGDDRDGITLIQIIDDSNGDGVYTPNETTIAYGKFGMDNGVLSIPLVDGYTINEGSTAYFLFLYRMSSLVNSGDNFTFQVASSSVIDPASGKNVKLIGLPINSAVTTVTGTGVAPVVQNPVACSNITNQTACSTAGCRWCDSISLCKNSTETCPTNCTGTMILTLEEHGNTSTARISGLSNCDGRNIYLKQQSCSGSAISSCSVSGPGCWVSFDTPGNSGNYTYFACIDKDSNGNFASDEQVSSVLDVTGVSGTPQPSSILDNKVVLIMVAVLVVSAVLIGILWLKKPKSSSKPYTYEYKP